ncbi:hypothetical protein VOLCADRAFT_67093 [Volvox carteri f. nagariensis]|uniref:NADP-dependent oxidoreductase domain-containing protein n=1 Tax=Volvox carteri f. nagariensis TaxID=3068 RepID=D8UD24_VOLCA|nr:uncharacterized protein VOLCADRAFT_67093 [Volvox carteri f. nagariensis]EFJ42320.1 hypothetical protein VOLCADRAFT_67093 [Volvox carteri f. nagariensis]|eukprot:XP_002956553.1 hypothetical protein VOLCADRAFT_67093 [Volvox carteri f. nagariensis]
MHVQLNRCGQQHTQLRDRQQARNDVKTHRYSRRSSATIRAFWQQLLPGRSKPSAPLGPTERPLYRPSELVPLGKLKVSPMGLGTWSWGNRFLWGYDESQDPELQELFNLVVSNGINIFDTADSYGTGRLNGKSELLLGKFTREYPGSDRVRDGVHIATKFAAYPWRVLPGNMVAACRGSLKRLGLEQLSVGQLHWSTANYQPLQELALQAGLADCYEQRLVREVGVSNYGPQQLKKIHAALAKRGVPLASAQIQFSLLSWGTAQQDLKALCDDLGVTVIAYSPLALGLLSGTAAAGGRVSPSPSPSPSLPPGPRGALFRQLLPEVEPLMRVVEEVARERGKTPAQVAINWCMAKGAVPIPGAKDLPQARENLGALGWRLGRGEVEELDRAARGIGKGAMVQNIFQTK